jgi:hypothetical protein
MPNFLCSKWLITICIAGLAFFAPHCLATDGQAARFISIFPCDEINLYLENGEDEDINDYDICLIGHVKTEQPIYLLASDTVCKTQTEAAKELELEGRADIMITPVSLGNCDSADYFLAWKGEKPSSFRPLQLIQETATDKISAIDKAVRTVFPAETSHQVIDNTFAVTPVLYKPLPQSSDIYIVHYITKDPLQEEALYGPIFWYAKGAVTLLDNQAEIAAFFSMYQNRYLLLRHIDWQGYETLSEQILNITDKGISIVHHVTAFTAD